MERHAVSSCFRGACASLPSDPRGIIACVPFGSSCMRVAPFHAAAAAPRHQSYRTCFSCRTLGGCRTFRSPRGFLGSTPTPARLLVPPLSAILGESRSFPCFRGHHAEDDNVAGVISSRPKTRPLASTASSFFSSLQM